MSDQLLRGWYQCCQRLVVWRSRNYAFSHDRRDQLRGGYIERRIFDLYTHRRDGFSRNVSDLSRVPLLDGNLAAVRSLKVNCGNGCRDVERNAVLLCQDRNRVGSDLIGNVAVSSDTVGTHDYGAYFSLPHYGA